jgi:hypothetical protein
MRARNIVMAAAMLSLAGGPLAAQQWKWDWGLNAGYSWITPMLTTDQTGLAEDAPSSKVKFANGSLFGTQLTFWPGAKLGLRLNARYADRDIKFSDMDEAREEFDPVSGVNLWGGSFDFMFRFKAPAAEYTGTEMLPYLALGVGLKWHNPGFDNFTCINTVENDSRACGPFVTGLVGSPRAFGLTEQKALMGHIGLGADWRLSRTLALRTELSDQIFKPRVMALNFPPAGATWTMTNGDESVAKTVHELGAQIGLHFLFGVARPAAVAVVQPVPEAPPPPPPPPVREEPRREEPIREESVTICVVDPTDPSGFRIVTASRILSGPSMGDTLVTVSGQRVPFRTTLGNVVVASNADWYVRGAPLTWTVANNKIEYHTYGSSQMIESGELAFLGTVNGIPVYADKDDIGDIRDELNDLNRAQRGADLARIMAEHKDLRTELAKVRVLYVPLQPAGCVFQPLQLQEAVRKGGK